MTRGIKASLEMIVFMLGSVATSRERVFSRLHARDCLVGV